MKRILVPSDLSEISENALRMATDIAERTGAEIFIVNFTDHPFGASFTATGEINKKFANEESLFTIQLIRKYHSQLSALAAKYGTANREIQYQVYDEDLKDGIEEYVREKNIDLIVMGTSGEESVDEFFSGNHAEQVIQVAACPVITTKSKYSKLDFKNIVLGLDTDHDRHDNFSQAATYINGFASSLGATVHIVNVSKSSADRVDKEKKLSDFAREYGIKSESVAVIEGNDNEKELIKYAHQKAASFLAIFTHTEDSFFKVFSHSLAEDLSMESDVPVLSINLHNI